MTNHLSGIVICLLDGEFVVLIIVFIRPLPPNIPDFDLSIGCKSYRTYHISPCNCGKSTYYLISKVNYIVMVQLIKNSRMQILTLPLLASYPFMTTLSGFNLQLVVNCASSLKNSFQVSAKILFLLCRTSIQTWTC